MLLEKELLRIFKSLLQSDVAQIAVDGNDITVRVFDDNSMLAFCTQVYFGGNFIPKSVRDSLSRKAPFTRDHVKSFFTVDEQNYLIYLNYIGKIDGLNNEAFSLLLEDFSWLADEWRFHLDEHDKNDLVHVRVK